MPPSLRLPVVLAVLAIGAFLWLAFVNPYRGTDRTRPPKSPGPPAAPAGTPSAPGPDTAPAAAMVDPTNTDRRFRRLLDGTVHWLSSFATSRQLHRDADPRHDLDLVARLLGDYRLVYKENPVGTENAEIVAQLLGGNPKKVVFIDPALPALNDQGELLDRWGSPYRFHPLRADLMDVLSIGPDRKPWTDDDLSLGLDEEERSLQLRPTGDR